MLKDGHALTDLMAAKANVTLIDGGTNTVTLGIERKVMLIQGITISKIPTAATAVSVTIAPLWQSVTVGGSFATAGTSSPIVLTRQADSRTWTPGPSRTRVMTSVLPPGTSGGAAPSPTLRKSPATARAPSTSLPNRPARAAAPSKTLRHSAPASEHSIQFTYIINNSSFAFAQLLELEGVRRSYRPSASCSQKSLVCSLQASEVIVVDSHLTANSF